MLAALAVGAAAGLPKAAMLRAVREFSGLPHRMQRVGWHGGAQWIDDSKATNVAAAVAALESTEPPCIWLAGGMHKGGDLTPLRAAARNARLAVFYGRAAQQLLDAVGDRVQQLLRGCLLYTSPSPRDATLSRMPSSA